MTMVPLRSNLLAAWSIVLVLVLFGAVAGCGVEKSENPLSPSVAGPIASWWCDPCQSRPGCV